MTKKFNLICATAILSCLSLSAGKPDGAITNGQLDRMRDGYKPTAAQKALRNAMNVVDINKLAASATVNTPTDMNFTYRVPSKGITDQKSSGRCWLFTGLNVLRGQAINQFDLGELKLSQVYNFFFDQLEKSNLFLQSVIDSADQSFDDRRVEWLFHNPLSDGGQFTGVSDIITKYGVVPAEIMPETYTANHTSQFSRLLGWKLKEFGLELRKMAADGASPETIAERKDAMLGDVFNMLAQVYGVPPTEFEYTLKDASGNVVGQKQYTPQQFYKEFFGNNLVDDYVMIMNDPTRPYYAMYEIDMDRHTYDGENWKYLNLPMDELKAIAIESLKDSAMMYFSCDVGKQFNRDKGTLDLDNFDFESLMGTTFGMNKRDRILTGASGSSHAMTLVGVDLDKDGKPTRWLIENSWGNGANSGHLIATDPWMDEYMFRLVVDKKYLPKKYGKMLNQEATLLPPWDYMF